MKTIKLILFALFFLAMPMTVWAWGTGAWGTGSSNAGGANTITMNDDVLLYFGTGNDFSIEFDATTSEMYIKTDTTSRNIAITDGDEPAIANSASPTLNIYHFSGTSPLQIDYDSIIASTNLTLSAPTTAYLFFQGRSHLIYCSGDLASGHHIRMYTAATAELTDTNGEQAFLSLEPKINQAGAAGANYVGLLMDVTETATDSGTNELMALRVATADRFTVENTGALAFGNGYDTALHTSVTTLTTTNINNCRGTPITLVAAGGANTIIEVLSIILTYDYASAAFTVGADEDLVVEYADGTDITASI